MEGRTVTFSRTRIIELMVPYYANFGGKVHGGTLMSLMDKVAYACACKHAGNYCVTVSVDAVEFLEPVEVGDMVSMLASVNYVGNTSLVVGIKVLAEDVRSGIHRHTNTSYFTMVAKDHSGNPTRVPPLVLESSDDVRRYCATLRRKELRENNRAYMKSYAENFSLDDATIQNLKDQRCIINLIPY